MAKGLRQNSDGLLLVVVDGEIERSAALMVSGGCVDAGGNECAEKAQTLDEAVALSTWEIRWQPALLAGLSALAVALAMVGLYGVVAFAVS